MFWVGAIFLGRSDDNKQNFFYGQPLCWVIYKFIKLGLNVLFNTYISTL